MSENYLQKALALAGNVGFVECPRGEDWATTEAELRICFPGPHKEFVNHFGTGVFGADLYLLNPASSLPQVRLNLSNLQEMREDKRIGYGLLERNGFVGVEKLVPIATTTSQVDICLVTGNPMSAELLVVHFGTGTWERSGMGTAEFLCKLYNRELPWAEEFRQLIWVDETDPFFRPIGG